MSENKYTRRIAGFHADDASLKEAVHAVTEPLAGITAFAEQLPLEFDLDTAIGAQLDAVGERVGISRTMMIPLDGVYFAFDTAGVGWDEGIWKGPHDPDTGLTTLDDDFYRILIRAKIALNQWDGTNETLGPILEIIFNDELGTYATIEDNQDMSITVCLSGKAPTPMLLSLLLNGYLDIKPGGVQIRWYVTADQDGPLFAYDVDNKYYAGWDKGIWGTINSTRARLR